MLSNVIGIGSAKVGGNSDRVSKHASLWPLLEHFFIPVQSLCPWVRSICSLINLPIAPTEEWHTLVSSTGHSVWYPTGPPYFFAGLNLLKKALPLTWGTQKKGWNQETLQKVIKKRHRNRKLCGVVGKQLVAQGFPWQGITARWTGGGWLWRGCERLSLSCPDAWVLVFSLRQCGSH